MSPSKIFIALTSLLLFPSSALGLGATDTGADGVELKLRFTDREFYYKDGGLRFNSTGGEFWAEVTSSKVELKYPIVFKLKGYDKLGNTEDWWDGSKETASTASDLPVHFKVDSLDEVTEASKGRGVPVQVGITVLNNKIEAIHEFTWPWGEDN